MISPTLRLARRTFVAVFLIITLLVSGIGYWYYQAQAAAIRQNKYQSIAAIAKMKVGQIVEWRKERLSDAKRAALGPALRRDAAEVIKGTANAEVWDDLRNILTVGKREGVYVNLYFTDAWGNLLLAAKGEEFTSLSLVTQQSIASTLASGEPVMSDFFREPNGHVHLDLVCAVRDNAQKMIGAVILRYNAEGFLYPLIQSWPTPSRSAETLLVRREGQELLFLNELRHQKQTALSLREPLTQDNLPTVKAVLGRSGMFEGKDYRGESVLADLTPVPGTSWFLVAKVDRSEILAEARYRAISTSIVVVSLILLAGSVTASAYRRRQAGLYLRILQAERNEQESQELFRATLYSIGDGVLTADTTGCVREMNPVAEWLTGWTEAEARGRPIEEVFVIVNQETRATVPNPVDTVLRDGVVVGLANHTILIARDGTEHAIADSAAPIRNASGEVSGVVLVFSDVTEEYQMRETLRRSEQQYRMLFEGMLEGFASHEVICDEKGKPVDYRFLSMNPAFERLTGLRAVDTVGRTVRKVLPQMETSWIERYGRVALTGEPISFEDYSGALGRHFAVTAFCSQPKQFAVVFEDITARKKANEQLHVRESFLTAITENQPGLLWLKDAAGRFLMVNKAFALACGREHPEQVHGLTDDDIWPQELARKYRADDQRVMLGGKSTIEEEEICTEGSRLWFETFKTPVCNGEGRVIGTTGYARDITQRKAAEARIVRLSELYATLSQCNQAIVRASSAEELLPQICRGVVNFGNMKMAWIGMLDEASETVRPVASFGSGVEYLEGLEISLKAEEPSARGPTGTAIRENRPFWCQDYQNDPCTVSWHERGAHSGWAASASLPLRREGKVIGALNIFSDKTGIFDEEVRKLLEEMADDISFALNSFAREIQRKQAEEALLESEQLFRTLFNSITDAVFVNRIGQDGRLGTFLEVNGVACQQLGYSREELLQMSPRDIDAPETQVDMHSPLVQRLQAGESVLFEQVHVAKDGRRIPIEIHAQPLIFQGQPALIALVRDITERQQAEAKLRLQSGALEAAANAIVITDEKGMIQWVNPAFTAYTGYSLAEVIGKTHGLLKSGKQDEAYYETLGKTIFSGKVWQGEIINRRKDGSLYTEEMTITPMKDKRGTITHFIAVKQDITERKQMEENILRTQRMESIGTLASGVAHDINNILTPIILSADMLRAAEDPETRENFITTIEECANRGAEVVNQVLTFARGAKGERKTLHLDCLVQEMEKIMHETFPKNITIVSSIPPELWTVQGDATQIHQVLLNFCINARDAMPKGGELRITTLNVEIDEHFAAMVPDAKVGDYVLLAVSDTGTGISRDIIGKIFDPFFTTKEVGKGTGLGLSTVMGIARSHGGFVTAESTERRGSTFKLFLPVGKGSSADHTHEVSIKSPQGGGATVLLVDDEVSILKVTEMVLKKNGYKVLTATNGAEALAVYKKHSREISLVLTDVMMPVMDGVELARALKKLNPRLKIITSTGQTTKNREAELRALGVQLILIKPFDAKKLLSVLHDAG